MAVSFVGVQGQRSAVPQRSCFLMNFQTPLDGSPLSRTMDQAGNMPQPQGSTTLASDRMLLLCGFPLKHCGCDYILRRQLLL